MQERYLGDSHDFIKYALLRHIGCYTGLNIGVNWYLTRPQDVDKPNNKDGEKRHHLGGKEWQTWQALDHELYDQIQYFSAVENRHIASFPKLNILPNCIAYYNTLVSPEARGDWHDKAKAALTHANLVFLDPDNGFEVKSMNKTSMAKYALYSEAAEWFRVGKAVVCIQFARQCNPIKRGEDVREKLCEAAGCTVRLPIIRGRVAPNILFIRLAPEQMVEKVQSALMSFGADNPKIEIIQ